jgi:hypothetical protein
MIFIVRRSDSVNAYVGPSRPITTVTGALHRMSHLPAITVASQFAQTLARYNKKYKYTMLSSGCVDLWENCVRNRFTITAQ